MVAIVRLDGYRQADGLRRFPSLCCTVHHLAMGHRYTASLQHALGHVFVAGNLFGNRAGLVGLSSPDTALCNAVTQLHQIAVGQARMRYAARSSGVDYVCCARPQAQRVHHVVKFFDACRNVKWCVVYGGLHQIAAQMQCATAHVFLAGTKGDFVNSRLGGLARFAKAGTHTGHGLQLQTDMLQNMCRPSAFLQPLQKAAAHPRAAFMLDQAGQIAGKALVKARQRVRGEIFQSANIDPCLNDCPVGPNIGSAQVVHPQNIDFFLARHAWGRKFKSTGLVRRALCILAESAVLPWGLSSAQA